MDPPLATLLISLCIVLPIVLVHNDTSHNLISLTHEMALYKGSIKIKVLKQVNYNDQFLKPAKNAITMETVVFTTENSLSEAFHVK